jgi:hypothetical protein
LHLSGQTKEKVTRDNGEVESESEEIPLLVDCSDEEIAYPVEGEALVIRCALNMQIKEDDVDHLGQYTFSDQFGFIFLNMEAESEERGGCPTKALCKSRTT